MVGSILDTYALEGQEIKKVKTNNPYIVKKKVEFVRKSQ
jgi:hypothetical protein